MNETLANTDDVVERLKIEVAACTRLMNLEGIMDYSGHVSARVPGRELFVIQDLDIPRADVHPDNLLLADMDGNKVDGPVGLYPPAEVCIHSEIMKARPDIHSVAHIHPDTAILFTLADGPRLAPVRNHASRWSDGIPVHPDPAHINTSELGKALAYTLGSHDAALIRAHGIVVVAENVPAVLIDSVHFIENADAFYKAAQLGPVLPLTRDEMESFLARFRRPRHVRKLWNYYMGRGIEAGMVPSDWAGIAEQALPVAYPDGGP